MSMIPPLPMEPEMAVRRVTRRLEAAGLQVGRSFDLQSARESLADPDGCTCPYHGTAKCDCQYVVLMANLEGLDPVAIELHGHDEETRVTLIEVAGVPRDEGTVKLVRDALAYLAAPDLAGS